MKTTLDVVAAVFLRADGKTGEYLLAQRPPDKVYAGYWKFPGGKVEAGETRHDALLREIREELGVEIENASLWRTCEASYPHADVHLSFFRVRSWRGEIARLEHSDFAWVKIGETPKVVPVLPANDEVLQALARDEGLIDVRF